MVALALSFCSAAASARVTQLRSVKGVAPVPFVSAAGAYAFQDGQGSLTYGALSVRAKHRIAAPGAGCRPRAADGQLILISCEQGSGAYRAPLLLNVATSTIGATPQFTPNAEYIALGSEWIAGIISSNGGQTATFVDWHSGEQTTRPPGAYDLSTPDLVARPRPRLPGATTAAYDAKYVLAISNRTHALLLKRRRRGRITTLSSCRSTCGSVGLAGDVVAWSEGRSVKRYITPSRRRRTWTFAKAKRAPGILVAPASDGRLLASVPYLDDVVDWRAYALS